MNIPLWLLAILLVSHLVMFILGAVGYHGVRMLAGTPLYRPNVKGQQVSEAQLQKMADQMLKKSLATNPFPHLTEFQGPPMTRETYVAEGDGKPKEETFAPKK